MNHNLYTAEIGLGKVRQRGPSRRYAPCLRCLLKARLTGGGSLSAPIHVLDDDSLLNVFSVPAGDFG